MANPKQISEQKYTYIQLINRMLGAVSVQQKNFSIRIRVIRDRLKSMREKVKEIDASDRRIQPLMS